MNKINMPLASILNSFRNSVWTIRRNIKGDPFEHDRQRFACFVVEGKTLSDIGDILTEHDYTLNEILQFEDTGQVLSGHHYYNFVRGIPQRQRHIRVIMLGKDEYEIRSHEEYSWIYAPIKHLRGVDVKNDCDYTKRVFSVN